MRHLVTSLICLLLVTSALISAPPDANANQHCYQATRIDGTEQTVCVNESGSGLDVVGGETVPGSQSGGSHGSGPAVGPGETEPWDGSVPYCGPDLAELLDTIQPPAGTGNLIWTCRPPEGGPSIDVAAVGRQAATSLKVPEPVVVLGPEPSVNRWGVLAVGLPIWLWVDDQGAIDSSVSSDGIEVVLSARPGGLAVDWGDGTTSVCTSTTPRPLSGDPMATSPDCGHVYQQRGDYQIQVTAQWNVAWSAMGISGDVELSSQSTRTLPIREFGAAVIG